MWNREAFELLVLVTRSNAEFETTPGNDIDDRDIFGQAHRIVKWHQQNAERDTNFFGARRDRRGYWKRRGQVAVVDEVMLGNPDVVKSAVFTPYDLVENFAVEAVRRLTPS